MCVYKLEGTACIVCLDIFAEWRVKPNDVAFPVPAWLLCYMCSQALLLRKISGSPNGNRDRDLLVSRQARYHCATENSVLGERFYRDLVRVMMLCLLHT